MQGAAPQDQQRMQPRQGTPMAPTNDPRMAAAMDVVTADIPESLEQLVSEQEFAKKAKELLMSAGGQAAMNQTPPKPPTVAERVGQRAEEGVAGLLARLSPGIQQQGQQMAMAQRRPPMQGQRPPMPQQGMAGMPARNMQGMARGGVIGYAGPDGSQVGSVGGRGVIDSSGLTDRQRNSTPAFGMTPTASPMLIGGILKSLGLGPKYDFGGRRNEEFALESAQRNATPIPIGNASQPIPMLMEKYGVERVTAFIAEQKALKAKGKALAEAYGNSRAEAEAAGGLMQVEDLELMEEVFAEKYRDILDDSMGMARGGIVGFDGTKGSQVEGVTPEMQRTMDAIALETQNAEAPLTAKEQMAASIARLEEKRERNLPANVEPEEPSRFNLKAKLLNEGYTPRQVERIISAGPKFETTNPQTGPFPPSLIGGNRRTGIMSGGGDGFPFGVDTGGSGGATTATTRDALLKRATGIAGTSLPTTNTAPNVTSEILEAMQNRAVADPTAAGSDARGIEQGLASQAYAMSPEMKAAYARKQQESDVEYAAQLDPKRLKDQKINALLTGLAAPGGIARGGIEALQGVTAVGDTATELRRKQSEERFGSAKEREGINREGRIKGFEAGRSANDIAYQRTSAASNAAFQALSNIDIGAQNRDNANRIADRRVALEDISMQLRSLDNQANLDSRDRNTQAKILSDAQRAAGALRTTIGKAIADSAFLTEEKKKPYSDFIAATQRQLAEVLEQIRFSAARVGIDMAVLTEEVVDTNGVIPPLPAGSGMVLD